MQEKMEEGNQQVGRFRQVAGRHAEAVVGISVSSRRGLQEGWARGRLRQGCIQRGVGRQKQADRGRQARYACSHSCWQVGRMKEVAGSGRAKGGSRQGKVEKQTQVGRSDKQRDAIWQDEA
jgi:hypothetical protein